MRALLIRAYSIAPLILCAATLGWAGNTIAGRAAVGEISPMLLIFLRWTLAVTIMLTLKGREMWAVRQVMRRHLLWVVLMGSCGFSFFNGLFYIAAHYTTAINMGIMQGAIPAIILIGSFLVFGTRITKLQVAGLIVAAIGVVVIVVRGSLADLLALRLNFGDVLMLITCTFYGIFALGLKNRPKIEAFVLFGYMAIAAMAMSVPMLMVELAIGNVTWPGAKGWLIVLFVAVVPSLLSQVFFMRGVDLIGPGNAGLYVNTIPVFAALLAIVMLGEQLHIYHIPAIALVFAGIYLFEMRGKSRASESGGR